MNPTAIDKSEHVAAGSSDLRSTNSWLASYGSDTVRYNRASETRSATRSSRSAARNLHLWAGAVVAAVLMFATTATEDVDAEGTSASSGHYPLDQNGGIAVASASLDQYLAALQERATARQFLLNFGDLLFSANSSEIGAVEKGELVRMADFLRAHPATVAQIVGHTDDRGDKTSNSLLAQQRAAVVRSYLVVQGIDQSRLTAASAGEEDPLRDNSTQAGRAGNRRVAILVQKVESGVDMLMQQPELAR